MSRQRKALTSRSGADRMTTWYVDDIVGSVGVTSSEFDARIGDLTTITSPPDVKDCWLCKKSFTYFLERHYCRKCEKIVCYNCSKNTWAANRNEVPERVCDDCYQELSSPIKLFHEKLSGECNRNIENMAIGIDLGTTNSCVAVLRKTGVEVISNNYSSRTTPSWVSFTEDEILIGKDALDESTTNLTDTIYDVKRLIGKSINNQEVQKDIQNWPFKVENDNEKPKIKLGKQDKTLSPEEISALVVLKMKQTAEDYLSQAVRHAVITVPANFNDSQRQATIIAGKIAGFQEVRIENEPTAAAIAYGWMNKERKAKNILVYDFGGGTFDVSVLQVTNTLFKVLATDGDTHLGGQDVDDRLVEHCLTQMNLAEQTRIRGDKRLLQHLRYQCEEAKKRLSCRKSTMINVHGVDGLAFCTEITRSLLDDLIVDLVSKTLDHVNTALRSADLVKGEINEVVLVGGSSCLLLVQEQIKKYFGDVIVKRRINPDEVVAYGAAILAGHWMNVDSDIVKNLFHYDVIPLSFGLATEGGEMDFIIKRNTPYPVKSKPYFYHTSSDYQTAATFKVYEGERVRVSDNRLLGEFRVTDLPRKPRGEVKFKVTFEIDRNGVIKVIVELENGKKETLEITGKTQLSSEEIQRLIGDAQTFQLKDERWRDYNKKKVDLQEYIHQMKRQAETSDKISEKERQEMIKICSKTSEELTRSSASSEKDYSKLEEELKNLFKPLEDPTRT